MQKIMNISNALSNPVGMWDQRNKRIGDLSGGQKQRICLARIFATDPDLFVLDEPTAGMDKASKREILSFITPCMRSSRESHFNGYS